MKICNNFCEHCGTRYQYQASGHGCGRELNDAKYCPSCKKAILKVLKKIPKKFKWKQKGTDEVTLDQLLQWEKESTSPYRLSVCPGKGGTMPFYRITFLTGKSLSLCVGLYRLSSTKRVWWDVFLPIRPPHRRRN